MGERPGDDTFGERFGERLGERLGERFGEMVCNKLGESLLSR